MSYFTMSAQARHAAQTIWLQRTNPMLQMSCFTRLMARIDDATRALQSRTTMLKANEEGLRIVDDVLARTLEEWRQAEPSLRDVIASDAFSIKVFVSPDDANKLEVVLNEELLQLSRGEHAVEMLAPTSPEFVGQAVRAKVSPMQLWKKLYGDARF
ncbi:hypothetical protein ZHS_106 [Edwardsiella phage vB_EpM_ZHS]|nr:hypothetical protein ZHS_106 [Edwardsiella phage vB_EpM_ZHS]